LNNPYRLKFRIRIFLFLFLEILSQFIKHPSGNCGGMRSQDVLERFLLGPIIAPSSGTETTFLVLGFYLGCGEGNIVVE
jgi:hypothetical protein